MVSDYFTGDVWLQMLAENDSLLNTRIGNVTFESGARTNWHIRPGGQILLVTDGVGYYQEKGKTIRLMHKGDVIICPKGAAHWHGATPDNSVTHIAISTNVQQGGVIWLQQVTDKEYDSFKSGKYNDA